MWKDALKTSEVSQTSEVWTAAKQRALEAEIDRRAYARYGLTADEIALVEGKPPKTSEVSQTSEVWTAAKQRALEAEIDRRVSARYGLTEAEIAIVENA